MCACHRSASEPSRLIGDSSYDLAVPTPNSLIGAAGEYLVAAELSRRGWLATVTIKNAPGTDVLAQHHASKRVVAVQTKTTSRGGSWILGIGEESPTLLDNEWIILVSLGWMGGAPQYWVMPKNHVAAYLWVGHRRWLKGVKVDGTARKDTRMRNVLATAITGYQSQWDWLDASSTNVPYSLLPDWVHEGLQDPDIGLPQDHPDARSLGAVLIQ